MAIPVSPYDAMVQRRVAPLMPQPVAPVMPQMSSGAPEDYMARAAAMRAQAMAGAQQGIDPRIAAILQQREARLAEQETALGAEEKRSPWEALMRAGAAMAGSQSRTFGGGLAEGVNAGLGALNRSRAEGLRQRDLIAQGRESLGMERISQEGAGRRAAMSDFESQVSLADKLANQAKAQADARLAIAKSIPDPVMRRLEVMKAEREIAEIDSKILENRSSAARAMRPEAAGGGAGGAGGAGAPVYSDTRVIPPEEAESLRLPRGTTWQRKKNGEVIPVGGARMVSPPLPPGKLADLDSMISGLKDAEAALAKGGVTGPKVALIPDMILPFVNPEAVDVREKVAGVTQRTLKDTLGGQFARVEGEEFLKRGFNPALPESVNLSRVLSLRKKLEATRDEMASRERPYAIDVSPPTGAVAALRQNPSLAAQFDQKYGAGAAARALGRR